MQTLMEEVPKLHAGVWIQKFLKEFFKLPHSFLKFLLLAPVLGVYI